jgi:L-iditol 2-dehydrogenase
VKAAVFYAPGDVRLEEIAEPVAGVGEVLVRIHRATTCGTDLKTYRRGHPTIMQKVPTPFGHEFAGTIAAVGPGVDTGRWRPGQRVVAANSAPCTGAPTAAEGGSPSAKTWSSSGRPTAEYIAVPAPIVEQNLYRCRTGSPLRRRR